MRVLKRIATHPLRLQHPRATNWSVRWTRGPWVYVAALGLAACLGALTAWLTEPAPAIAPRSTHDTSPRNTAFACLSQAGQGDLQGWTVRRAEEPGGVRNVRQG